MGLFDRFKRKNENKKTIQNEQTDITSSTTNYTSPKKEINADELYKQTIQESRESLNQVKEKNNELFTQTLQENETLKSRLSTAENSLGNKTVQKSVAEGVNHITEKINAEKLELFEKTDSLAITFKPVLEYLHLRTQYEKLGLQPQIKSGSYNDVLLQYNFNNLSPQLQVAVLYPYLKKSKELNSSIEEKIPKDLLEIFNSSEESIYTDVISASITTYLLGEDDTELCNQDSTYATISSSVKRSISVTRELPKEYEKYVENKQNQKKEQKQTKTVSSSFGHDAIDDALISTSDIGNRCLNSIKNVELTEDVLKSLNDPNYKKDVNQPDY